MRARKEAKNEEKHAAREGKSPDDSERKDTAEVDKQQSRLLSNVSVILILDHRDNFPLLR